MYAIECNVTQDQAWALLQTHYIYRRSYFKRKTVLVENNGTTSKPFKMKKKNIEQRRTVKNSNVDSSELLTIRGESCDADEDKAFSTLEAEYLAQKQKREKKNAFEKALTTTTTTTTTSVDTNATTTQSKSGKRKLPECETASGPLENSKVNKNEGNDEIVVSPPKKRSKKENKRFSMYETKSDDEAKESDSINNELQSLTIGDPIIIIGDKAEKLASGSLVNTDEKDKLHGQIIGEGNVAVAVASIWVAAKKSNHILKFPVPQHLELKKVAEVSGYVIRWPMKLLTKNKKVVHA